MVFDGGFSMASFWAFMGSVSSGVILLLLDLDREASFSGEFDFLS